MQNTIKDKIEASTIVLPIGRIYDLTQTMEQVTSQICASKYKKLLHDNRLFRSRSDLERTGFTWQDLVMKERNWGLRLDPFALLGISSMVHISFC